MTQTAQAITYRIQVAATDSNDLADSLHRVANDLDEGTTSGYMAGAYDFEQVSPTTPIQALPANSTAIRALVEITETTIERITFTLRIIADMIGEEGFNGGADNHDEGSYSFVVER